jgi:hypothetical protein
MTDLDLLEYLSKLWAMLVWGNKKYVVDKMISANGLEKTRDTLADLVWGSSAIEERWDRSQERLNGLGPAMASELLCLTHPGQYVIWNRRALVALDYLEVKKLPRYNYQLTGARYVQLIETMKTVRDELANLGYTDADFLLADYFLWDELQVEPVLNAIGRRPKGTDALVDEIPTDETERLFVHNEVRDKIADIGEWLGFTTGIEKNVAAGARVDTIWEATIGNMGRVVYVFEVQTKGSVDSLILNLMKCIGNPAVQGVVAVSDTPQLAKIKEQCDSFHELGNKLRLWDFREVLEVHDALSVANEKINTLQLVPQGF